MLRQQGIVFSSEMSWNLHVDMIVAKVSKRINIMKLIQRQIPRICLEDIYEYMILPFIEYADVIYDNLPNRLVKDLELLQRQAALCCTGGYKHTKHVELLKELGWEQLSLRRKCHRLFIMYKIINNNTPLYLKRLIPDTVVDHTGYNLRSANNFTIPIYVKSFCKNLSYHKHCGNGTNCLCIYDLRLHLSFSKHL